MKNEQYKRHERSFDLLLKFGLAGLRRRLLDRVYDASFYEETRERKLESFRRVAAILARHLAFDTVLDIGCGTGLLIAELKKIGKDVLGCEISEAAISGAPRDVTVFQADAARPIRVNRRFDLVVCIEVAEHIQRRHSRRLVENCTSLGGQICFTAAPAGQGGVGHINLRPHSFWIELFARRGFVLQAGLADRMREQMRAEGVLRWIPDNLMVFSGATAGVPK